MVTTPQLRFALWLLAGIAACLSLTALVYWNGLTGGFTLDDGANIVIPYEYIKDPSWQAVWYVVTHNGSGLLGRSVSVLSFVLTGLQYGLDAWGYKYHNLLLHLLNGVLLFYLVQLLLPLLDRQLEQKRMLLVAGATATLWLLHPLQVSTVLYAVQRMTQLSALFTLLALIAYVKARLDVAATRQFYVAGWLLFPLFTLLAVLSKEKGALVPAYVLAVELLVFRTAPQELRRNRRLAVFFGVFVAAPLLLAAAALIIEFDALANYNNRTFTLSERLLTQVHVVFFYMRMIFLPRIRDMSLFHDDYATVNELGLITLALIGLLALMLVATWRLRSTLPVVAFGLSWFFVSHLMESTIFPLEMVFEHRNYLALAGFTLVVSHALFAPARVVALRWVFALLVGGFSFLTMTRSTEWGNPEVFYSVALTEHPESGRALNYYLNFMLGQNRFDEATELLEKQVALTPDEAGAWLHLNVVLCPRGMRNEEALHRARELLGTSPASVYALNGLQSLMNTVVNGVCSEYTLDEISALIETALAFATEHAYSQNEAFLLRMRGVVALQQGLYAQGYAFFRMAHELTEDIALLAELARFQIEMERLEDAEETLALMEMQNAARFGVDEYQLVQSREMLSQAKATAEQAGEIQAAEVTP